MSNREVTFAKNLFSLAWYLYRTEKWRNREVTCANKLCIVALNLSTVEQRKRINREVTLT